MRAKNNRSVEPTKSGVLFTERVYKTKKDYFTTGLGWGLVWGLLINLSVVLICNI